MQFWPSSPELLSERMMQDMLKHFKINLWGKMALAECAGGPGSLAGWVGGQCVCSGRLTPVGQHFKPFWGWGHDSTYSQAYEMASRTPVKL